MISLLLILLFCGASAAAAADELVLDVSRSEVSITTTFSGSDIIVYGARVPTANKAAGPVEIVITITGPDGLATLREKTQIGGIWVNTEAAHYAQVPSYYAVASSALLSGMLEPAEDSLFQLSPAAQGAAFEALDLAAATPENRQALVRLLERTGRFAIYEGAVEIAEGVLFRADIAMPASIVEGIYEVRVMLVREGRIEQLEFSKILVRKSSLEAAIHDLAHERALLYGLISLVVAITAGYCIAALSRIMKG